MNNLISSLKKISYLIIPLIFFLISYFVDWNLAFSSLKNINSSVLLLSLLVTFLYPIIGAFRWREITNSFGIKINIWNSFKAVMVAFSANLVAPAKSGDFVKAYATNISTKKEKLGSAVISERIIDLISLGILGLLGSFYLENYLLLIFNIIMLMGILGVLILANLYFEKLKLIFSSKISDLLLQSLLLFKAKRLGIVNTLFFSLLNWIVGGLQVWLLFLSLGENISPFIVLSIFPITVLISIIPITPGGLGVRESGFIFMFLPFISTHVSTLVSLFYYIFVVLFLALIGVFFTYYIFWHENKNTTKS